MEQKTRQAKGKAEELLKFPQQVERELEYWMKEKRVSCIEQAIKANDLKLPICAKSYTVGPQVYIRTSPSFIGLNGCIFLFRVL